MHARALTLFLLSAAFSCSGDDQGTPGLVGGSSGSEGAGASGGGIATNQCEPGTEKFCRCSGGFPSGTKFCEPDGKSFGECFPAKGECPAPTETGGHDPGGNICVAGTEVFCKCAETDPDTGDFLKGSKKCNEDELGFSECVCLEGVGGAGGGAVVGGSLPLASPCFENGDCEDGLCDMGYCTKSCTKDADCAAAKMVCISDFAVDGSSACAPSCWSSDTCETTYGFPSACGYAVSIDFQSTPDGEYFGYGVCGDWILLADTPPLPPVGYDCSCPEGDAGCDKDVFCTLGQTDARRVCDSATSYCAETD